ncbi:MAG: DUF433 domain-containing protein [Gemmataceae bacterium]
MSATLTATDRIRKTPNVCGGSARIGDHRITVWHMVLDKKMGLSDASILSQYPALTQDDLDACWDFYRRHPVEIEQDIWFNDTAANQAADGTVPPWVVVAGCLLGIAREDVCDSFDPPLTPADVDAAWAAYRADPAAIERQIARHRQYE